MILFSFSSFSPALFGKQAIHATGFMQHTALKKENIFLYLSVLHASCQQRTFLLLFIKTNWKTTVLTIDLSWVPGKEVCLSAVSTHRSGCIHLYCQIFLFLSNNFFISHILLNILWGRMFSFRVYLALHPLTKSSGEGVCLCQKWLLTAPASSGYFWLYLTKDIPSANWMRMNCFEEWCLFLYFFFSWNLLDDYLSLLSLLVWPLHCVTGGKIGLALSLSK